MLKNTEHQFGLIQIIIHWLSAIAVFGLFFVGIWMVDLSYYSEWYRTAPDLHKSVGLTLLALTLFRVFWVLINPKPQALAESKLEQSAGKLGHSALYILLLVIMVSGYLISTADGRGIEVFGLFEVPSLGEFIENQEDVAGDIHEWGAYILMGVVALHIVAALKHHFLNKDRTLIRMIKPN
ncbi:cytochrome b [Psychrosphaera ytuae]|uniref:Cytochrome b n=1 Tax=Psychrosphaera ytuae TaxID=2820710 RepID=A0A975DBC6_9GAMM|nr:cytochrome b [Psychrosphaera ytuae]QTH63728.1 cytochrome b [Psychrosphaera ytuae]